MWWSRIQTTKPLVIVQFTLPPEPLSAAFLCIRNVHPLPANQLTSLKEPGLEEVLWLSLVIFLYFNCVSLHACLHFVDFGSFNYTQIMPHKYILCGIRNKTWFDLVIAVEGFCGNSLLDWINRRCSPYVQWDQVTFTPSHVSEWSEHIKPVFTVYVYDVALALECNHSLEGRHNPLLQTTYTVGPSQYNFTTAQWPLYLLLIKLWTVTAVNQQCQLFSHLFSLLDFPDACLTY